MSDVHLSMILGNSNGSTRMQRSGHGAGFPFSPSFTLLFCRITNPTYHTTKNPRKSPQRHGQKQFRPRGRLPCSPICIPNPSHCEKNPTNPIE